MLWRYIKALQKRESFLTTPFGMVTNAAYFIRRGLYKTISVIAPTFDGIILDFGCGSKPYRSLFTNVISYIGVDIMASGHDHSTSQVDVYYDGKIIPFADSTFDGVVSFEVFEHIFNLEDTINEIKRVLKNDGQIMITMPFAWFEHEQPYDFARYTSFAATHILKKNGFNNIVVKKTTGSTEAIFQLFIEYIFSIFKSQSLIIRTIVQLLVIFPMTFFSTIFCLLLPKHDDLYCNLVIVARKLS
ncbi:MAG: class I SAM-dependent methyltransferase [Candidatus Obscuribacterales bacterium]|nr:class I SAM-dependent methyltransferase [Candidatus Obscuribacterales bacterium]